MDDALRAVAADAVAEVRGDAVSETLRSLEEPLNAAAARVRADVDSERRVRIPG